MVDGFKEGKVVAGLEIGRVGSNEGSGKDFSSEDSENTGVPYLKEVFSEELEDEEEEISSIIGEGFAIDRGVA